ncbi:TPA: lanthionine synthetase LanC family protein [Clostridioides difficile]
MILQKSSIDLDKASYKKIEEIVEWYMYTIKQEYRNDYISPFKYEDYLIAISETLPLLDDKCKDVYLEIGYSLIKGIKHKLEYDFEFYKNSSMIIGLGYSAFAVNIFFKKTGLLKNFSHSLNSLLLEECYNRVVFLINNTKEGTNDIDYDLIYGVSGVLNYILDFEWSDEYIVKIKKMGEYLIYMSSDYEYDGYIITKYHMRYEYFINDVDKSRFPKGCVNFGIAHGILGPLISMAKLKNKVNSIDGIDKAIYKILNLYDVFVNKDKDYYRWPTQVSVEDYTNKMFDIGYSQIASWCYGSTSIANGLKNVYLSLNENYMVYEYRDILKKLLTEDFDEYGLYTPNLCHGYSSLLTMITVAYKETNDKLYLYNLERNLHEIFQSFNPSLRYGFESLSDMEKIENTSILEGTTGIVLSLISVLSDETCYEKLLFLK